MFRFGVSSAVTVYVCSRILCSQCSSAGSFGFRLTYHSCHRHLQAVVAVVDPLSLASIAIAGAQRARWFCCVCHQTHHPRCTDAHACVQEQLQQSLSPQPAALQLFPQLAMRQLPTAHALNTVHRYCTCSLALLAAPPSAQNLSPSLRNMRGSRGWSGGGSCFAYLATCKVCTT